MVLMELIVDVVIKVTLSGPQGADSRPDLPILHTAQPLSCCNYLSHCKPVCVLEEWVWLETALALDPACNPTLCFPEIT